MPRASSAAVSGPDYDFRPGALAGGAGSAVTGLGRLAAPIARRRLLRRSDLSRGDPHAELALVPLELPGDIGGRGLLQHLHGAGLVAVKVVTNTDEVIGGRQVPGPFRRRLDGLRIAEEGGFIRVLIEEEVGQPAMPVLVEIGLAAGKVLAQFVVDPELIGLETADRPDHQGGLIAIATQRDRMVVQRRAIVGQGKVPLLEHVQKGAALEAGIAGNGKGVDKLIHHRQGARVVAIQRLARRIVAPGDQGAALERVRHVGVGQQRRPLAEMGPLAGAAAACLLEPAGLVALPGCLDLLTHLGVGLGPAAINVEKNLGIGRAGCLFRHAEIAADQVGEGVIDVARRGLVGRGGAGRRRRGRGDVGAASRLGDGLGSRQVQVGQGPWAVVHGELDRGAAQVGGGIRRVKLQRGVEIGHRPAPIGQIEPDVAAAQIHDGIFGSHFKDAVEVVQGAAVVVEPMPHHPAADHHADDNPARIAA